ncbi:hypothetical protein [Spirosoma validum]|uniref:General stress protein 17M-like domain-containing protein n=1 Tax=Spirosoma validum TaxID=2771355 RepID=A0A927B9F0_9BACT|nr:hypothetical protein [Spirosoma validum]MBD2757606.1 hypothetical protein [Spirosoma validum]
MGLTVVGIFKTASEAQQALDQLVTAGFLQNNLELSDQSGTPISADLLVPDPSANASGLPPEKLVDDAEIADGERNMHQSAQFADQDSVVAVHAQTDDEAKQAVQILKNNGAVDVNERVGTYNLVSKQPGGTTSEGLI